MAKTSVDDLLAAIRTVGFLKEAVEKQEQSIQALIARLNRVEAMLGAQRLNTTASPTDTR